MYANVREALWDSTADLFVTTDRSIRSLVASTDFAARFKIFDLIREGP